MTNNFFKKHALLFYPLVAFLLFLPFSSYLDLFISNLFYNTELKTFETTSFFDFIFVFGLVPGQLLAAASLLVLFASYVIEKWKKGRAPALFLVLTLALGSGILTHALLKDHWGRPRPRQIENYNGKEAFRPFYSPNIVLTKESSESFKSFPCGHCTMGFYFFALYFLGKRLKMPRLSHIGLFLAFFLGILLSYTRIKQGGHFLSDIFVGALIMWYSAFFCDYLIYDKLFKKLG